MSDARRRVAFGQWLASIASSPRKELFQFLVELSFNNNRGWFAENKERYEEHVKRPLVAFLDRALGIT